jgi:hypothetical protein
MPTDTAVPPSPTPNQVFIATPKPGTVVLDFVALVCNAKWANGARAIPCPGNLNDVPQGYIASTSSAIAEGQIPVNAPALIALPGQGGTYGAGLFGRYPSLKIQPGDTFKAMLACLDPYRCSVDFSLEYYDVAGKYHPEMNWSWKHAFGGGPFPVEVDLSSLAGQTVDLTLVVRDSGDPQNAWVLWMYPVVTRNSP